MKRKSWDVIKKFLAEIEEEESISEEFNSIVPVQPVESVADKSIAGMERRLAEVVTAIEKMHASIVDLRLGIESSERVTEALSKQTCGGFSGMFDDIIEMKDSIKQINSHLDNASAESAIDVGTKLAEIVTTFEKIQTSIVQINLRLDTISSPPQPRSESQLFEHKQKNVTRKSRKRDYVSEETLAILLQRARDFKKETNGEYRDFHRKVRLHDYRVETRNQIKLLFERFHH
jgi:predicted  nucleic acid-binding Zn-ribbon protein